MRPLFLARVCGLLILAASIPAHAQVLVGAPTASTSEGRIGPGRVANAGRAGPAESPAVRTGCSESGAGCSGSDRTARGGVPEPVCAQLEHVPVLGPLEQHHGRPGALAAVRGFARRRALHGWTLPPRNPGLEHQGQRGQCRLARSTLFRQLRADRPHQDQRALGPDPAVLQHRHPDGVHLARGGRAGPRRCRTTGEEPQGLPPDLAAVRSARAPRHRHRSRQRDADDTR